MFYTAVGQDPPDLTRPTDGRELHEILIAWKEQLVNAWTLGQLTSHIVWMVSVPILSEALDTVSQDDEIGEQEQTVKASPWVASPARRLFDCVVAATALLLLLPVSILCWLAVRFSSPGPVFFRQRRMGAHGREFELYKFRSMHCTHPSAGPKVTVQNDLRITPVGRLLRRYKLDELPQFWNVLKGDMSLVGPRPKLPEHEPLHLPYRPGLTGRATLAFRHEEKMLMEVPGQDLPVFMESVVKPIKVLLDIRYMATATFLDDVGILARTLVRCLHCSVDTRRELRDLMWEHTPEHLGKLAPPRFSIPTTKPQTFVPELTDEFAGDLNDLA